MGDKQRGGDVKWPDLQLLGLRDSSHALSALFIGQLVVGVHMK